MRLRTGIFLGYLLIALLAAFFVFNVFVDEIKPGARQAMEDSLLDSANLLAEIARDDLLSDRLTSGRFAERVAAYQARDFRASIWGFNRAKPGLRVYITDDKGIVKFDSSGEALGQDYSRWNDVYLTLKGKYGVRSSPNTDAGDSPSTTMHVAAPIRDQGKIIGVLTLAKSNLAVEPFIERTKNKIFRAGYGLLLASLLIGLLMTYWLSISVQKLVSYAEAVALGERAVLPGLSITELKRLGKSLQSMRERLEGKRYVEEYVWTLTHEMKSPLTAIQASSELLEEPMPEAQRAKFLKAIREQTLRLHDLIEKMLRQASLEYRQALEDPESLDLSEVLQSALDNLRPKLLKKKLSLTLDGVENRFIRGERFLIEQAFLNVMENAIDFSPEQGLIRISVEENAKALSMQIEDQGPGIPDYAREKVFDRFYSLPRPDSGAKSTGLGLSFVKQVMVLHQGTIELANRSEGGVEARMVFQKKS